MIALVVCILAPLGMRAVVVTTPGDSLARLERLVRLDGTLTLEPLVGRRDPSHHAERVHWAHVRALKKCGTEPCLILESDAFWDETASISAAIEAAVNERPDWELLQLGINPRMLQADTRAGQLTLYGVKRHSALLSASARGCHAYVARHPEALADTLRARPDPATFPCIEQLSIDGVVLATDILVLQDKQTRGEHLDRKKGHEATEWRIEDNDIKIKKCSWFRCRYV